MSNSGGQDNLNADLVRSIAFPLPEEPQQRKVGAILKTWDSAIAILEGLIGVIVENKRGLMQRLLSGKWRFKDFKGERWRTVRMSELLREVNRYVEFDDASSYKLASIRRRSEGLFFREELRGSEIKTKVMKRIRTGDFLLSKMQVVHGAWGLVTPKFDGMFVSDSYISLVPREPDTLKVEFFNYLSQTRYLRHQAYLACHGVHIEKMTFSIDNFLNETISIPSTVEEQMKIVRVLAGCDRKIDLLQKQLYALNEQKRGLMQKLLTGKIPVKVSNGK
jgi:type I restriction enzyme S subunit